MKKSWLTAASALAAMATEASPASAQLFTTNTSSLDFPDTLVGATTNAELAVIVKGSIVNGEVPAGTAPFSGGPIFLSGLMKGDEAVAQYSFSPTQTGSASETLKAFASNIPLKQVQSENIVLSGVGVAPIESLTTSFPPDARVGTTSLQTVTVTNTGDGNLSGLGSTSDLRGNLGSSAGVFQGSGGTFDLKDGASADFSYDFAPTARGMATGTATATFQNGSADGKNQAGSQDVSLSGQGVGPQYSSSVAPGGVIDLGFIKLGGSGTADLKISNVSTDLDLKDPTLTDLSLLSSELLAAGHPPSTGFDLENFVPDTVLAESDSFDLKIKFSATSLGVQTAGLVIGTDQNAAFGKLGQTFSYRLTADVVTVPEAQTWEMFLVGFGALGLEFGRRRRSGLASEASGETSGRENDATGKRA